MRSEGNGNNNSSRSRLPTWTEMENNRRRERRRRAIASKIYAGLRAHGNYKLHKHCDNNEVLKALCQEAGWTVEDDGTTYRKKGCKPMDVGGSASLCSSYHPSPFASYNPSPSSSSFPSPKRSCNININVTGDESLLPWLKNFSHAAKTPNHNNLYYGSVSAPVTPPLSSSPSRSLTRSSREATGCTFLPSSSMSSPDRQVFPDSSLPGVPISPTFSLISSNKLNPFGSARMWTPGVDVQVASDEFAFGSSIGNGTGLLKAWEGERIHGECAPDELELTLGTSKTGLDA